MGIQTINPDNSHLSYFRVRNEEPKTENQIVTLQRMIADGDSIGLDESILQPLRFALENSFTDGLSNDEVRNISNAVEVSELSKFGVRVTGDGIDFDGETSVGATVSVGTALRDFLSVLKPRIVFNGMVEVRGNTLEEYRRYDIYESCINERHASLTWN